MTAVEEKTTLQPEDLQGYSGLLVVQNNSVRRIVHAPLEGPALYLSPKGSHGSTTQLPEKVAEDTDFQRLWRRGLVTVLGGSAAEVALSHSEDAGAEERSQRKAEVLEKITDAPGDNDLIPNFTPGRTPTFSTPEKSRRAQDGEIQQGQVIEQYIGDDGEVYERAVEPTILDKVIGG